MKKALLAALCALAAGCSTSGQVDPDTLQIATAPLTCANRTECDMWWKRAQTWVTQESSYGLQSVSDTLIQTAGPDGGKRALAYQITKTDNKDGTATIGFAAHCDSAMGCKPNPWEAGASFKRFVRGGAANASPAGQQPASAPAATTQLETGPAQSTHAPTGEPVTQ
ncbi:hypothetical protein [Paraburkholderia saeva]|uniref:Lipoprotein n=1 Tax=Paraburkholderia saeva TaxID=2777537 RepID=A0A9N8RYR8_9BURK|nr:hypothetical protein [Paraburkholderia saeva]CAG4902491.1 hypothetical protein R70241_02971 [Paraburkholderia saeva]CAG4908032.1 hypothetical protein LMG31841_03717 [Paraburkholderia saeva]CAG4911077.1 hypothetical protein R52603_03892 [Paraburkholderia saeva]